MNPEGGLADGVIVGYDPGGNGSHGFAALSVRGGVPVTLVTETLRTAEEVVSRLESLGVLLGLGVDTLTCWSTGPSGWRPADRWLRCRYPEVQNSVASPNSLFGSMGLGGMAVLIAARQTHPSIAITETHPKILCWHLLGKKYDYAGRRAAMDEALASLLAVPVDPANDHEWDAALSALAVLEGLSGRWSLDLHGLPTSDNERIVSPCGPTFPRAPQTPHFVHPMPPRVTGVGVNVGVEGHSGGQDRRSRSATNPLICR